MQRFLILVAVCLLSGCLTAPPKEAAKTNINASGPKLS